MPARRYVCPTCKVVRKLRGSPEVFECCGVPLERRLSAPEVSAMETVDEDREKSVSIDAHRLVTERAVAHDEELRRTSALEASGVDASGQPEGKLPP